MWQVLYGQDYTADDRASQHQETRDALLEHFRFYPPRSCWSKMLNMTVKFDMCSPCFVISG